MTKGRQEQARDGVKDYERLRPAGHDAVAMINYQPAGRCTQLIIHL
jgi:hypothetical protein